MGDASDEHAAHIFYELETLGVDVEFLSTADFPQSLQISYQPPDAGHLVLPAGRRIEFDEIQSVYWRSYQGAVTPALPDETQSYIAQNDARSLLESFVQNLPARWVNGWAGYQLHQTKPAALQKAVAAGARIPATTITNDPESVREFARSHPQCIFKPVQGGAHTQMLNEEHLTDENLLHLQIAPVTLQQQIEGDDIRVFVAGEQVLACEIKTSAVDFRDDPHAAIIPHTLPAEMQELSKKIAAALHLVWTGIDYRRTPAGDYIFLEANPSPMFLGFESRTGLPLTAALVKLLQD